MIPNTGNAQGSNNTFDLSECAYVKRIVVGSVDPQQMPTNEETEAQMALVNRCLTEAPKGKLLGMEKSFAVLRIGEHQVVLEAVAYHIGFKRVPYWLVDQDKAKRSKQDFQVDPEKVKQFIG